MPQAIFTYEGTQQVCCPALQHSRLSSAQHPLCLCPQQLLSTRLDMRLTVHHFRSLLRCDALSAPSTGELTGVWTGYHRRRGIPGAARPQAGRRHKRGADVISAQEPASLSDLAQNAEGPVSTWQGSCSIVVQDVRIGLGIWYCVNHRGRCMPCSSTTELRIIAPMTVLGISGTFNVLASETAF